MEDKELDLKEKAILKAIPKGVKTVADIGCGDRKFTNHLRKFYKVYAVDLEKTSPEVLEGDLTEPDDFPIKEVEVSIASEVLEHILNWQKALKTLIDITTKKVIITVPWQNSYYSPDHVNFWNDNSIKEFEKFVDKIKISKKITKPADVNLNQLIYFIEIWLT